ncbi:MAG: alkaline phosphatase D family protein, partial [Verrucomicrobia bacterium]|nr:alkaline phosphatase D family protein [Verrucomicrobiota bacterium]
GPSGDSWAPTLFARDKLLNFIRDENISGVLLMSGDTHQGELNCIPWSSKGGYDFYEFVSSPLAQGTSRQLQRKIPEIYIREWYNDNPNFGYMVFDLREEDPVMRYILVDVSGDTVDEWFEIRASELVNGIESWPGKISESEQMKLTYDMYPDISPE